ncbi:MAG: hypothetical protein HY482_00690 [Candidatus Wildermuthbacteria bacterium]|nr:hypothetical protein [Candidatus Wildermuthbacteria bacterium]
MQQTASILVFCGILFGFATPVFAEDVVGDSTEDEAVASSGTQTVTGSDLEVADPAILPTSPLYFLKEVGRGIRGLFAFSKVAKAELQLKISNEKAAELRLVEEKNPRNGAGIEKALANYEKAQEALKARLEKLSETSENPRVDELLTKISDKTVVHEKLLREIADRHIETQALKDKIDQTKERVRLLVGKVAEKDDPEKFAKRFKMSLEKTDKGELGELGSIEALDDIFSVLPQKAKEHITQVRQELKEEARLRIEEVARERPDRLEAIVRNVPGATLKRAAVLEELRAVSGKDAGEALGKAGEAIENSAAISPDLMKAELERQIERVGKLLDEAEGVMNSNAAGTSQEGARQLVVRGREHLQKAKDALLKGALKEAFGQARAAEVAGRNAVERIQKNTENKQNRRGGIVPSDIAPSDPVRNLQIESIEFAP